MATESVSIRDHKVWWGNSAWIEQTWLKPSGLLSASQLLFSWNWAQCCQVFWSLKGARNLDIVGYFNFKIDSKC